MSLKVWLPLNGNLNNQGLDNVTLQSGTPAYSNLGKVTSKCLTVTSTTSALKYNALPNDTSYTICGWFYINAYSSYNTLFCNGTDGSKGFYVRCNGGIGNLQATVFGTAINYASFKASTWFHVALVIDCKNKKFSYYINGNLVDTKTYTQNELYTAGGFNIGKLRDTYYQLNGYVNDFHIYDECLSEKQIKELSKGLCLHYKLSRGGENLYPVQNITKWGFNGTGAASHSISNNKVTWTMSKDSTTHSNCGPFIVASAFKFETNTKYTVHFKWKITTSSKNGTSYYIRWEKPWVGYTGNIRSGEICEFTTTFTTSTSELASTIIIYGTDSTHNWTKGDTIELWDIKVEKGDHATSWLPNKSDTLYSQLGYNNIEPDCSGYGNDGTINGTLTYSNDTPRYEGSSYFGYTQNVQGNFALNSFPITISFWAKVSQFDTGGWVVLAGQSTGYYLDADSSSGANWHSKVTVQSYYRDGALVVSANTTTKFISRDGEWHHYVYICTLTDWTKMTVNGGSLWSSSWRANVNISDFRIYATALSADDIKALYNNPISIDNKNNLHCLELDENDNVSFGKSGVVKMRFTDDTNMLGIDKFIED